MAELKHQFTGGRMNKDLDERLVPNGEYRDALNVNVNVSEGSNVGTVQTTLGNILHRVKCTPYGQPAIQSFTLQARCIGSITDEKNDKLYWFIADEGAGIDSIAEYDINLGTIRPVIVDTYYNTGGRRALNFSNSNYITGINIIDDMLFWTDNYSEPKKINIPRSIQGSTDFCTCTKFLTKDYHRPLGGELIDNGNFSAGNTGWSVPGWSTCNLGVDDWVINNGVLQGLQGCASYARNTFTTPLTNGSYYKLTYTILTESSTSGIISLYWHDTAAWPGGSPNIEIPGTVGTHYVIFQQSNPNQSHWSYSQLGLSLHMDWTGVIDQISLVEVDPQSDPVNSVTGEPILTTLQDSPCIEEKHITVIKENPIFRPVLEMSQTPSRSSEDISGLIGPIDAAVAVVWGQTIGATWTSTNAAWWADNNGIMGWHGTGSYATSAYPPGHLQWFVFIGNPSWKVGDILILTSSSDPSREKQVKVEVVALGGGLPGFPNHSTYRLKILSIEDGVDAADLSWTATLEPVTTSLFEFKFPRFATRYKYQDGEYSAFSPFTEIAFLPGRPMDEDFKYEPKQGFNLGMTNNVRYLAIKNFVPEKDVLPDGVIAIDILYKESDSPNVYIVKTITPGDVEWNTQIDGGSTLSGTKGYTRIDSEMIHAVLPENQLLRPWDNVPRKALAQEVSGNRIIYGNYLQNYTVPSIELEIGLHSTCINPDCGNGLELGIPEEIYPENAHTYLPAKSIKTLRTYQLGVVFRDKYGRETPVITDDARISLSGKASIYVEKEWSDWGNSLTAKLHTQPPSWATTYKWFIKETSSEYYNLALDRWYDAQDWNVWLSFPSSERNKVDIETFLILKKEEDSNTFVHDDGRYKILAIENEAPDYIKERHLILAILFDNPSAISNPAIPANGIIGQAGGLGFPLATGNFIWIDEYELRNQGLVDSVSGELTLDTSKNLFLRVTGTNIYSEWYYIQSITAQTWAGNAPSALPFWQFKVEGMFDTDMNFTSTGNSYATRISGLAVEIKEIVTEDRPEFDGRFFAKIHRDLTLEDSIIKFGQAGTNWSVLQRFNTTYIGPRWTNGYQNNSPNAGTGNIDSPNWAYNNILRDNYTNLHDWANNEWHGWGNNPDYAYGQMGGNNAEEYWDRLGGGGGFSWNYANSAYPATMFIDNTEYSVPSYDRHGFMCKHYSNTCCCGVCDWSGDTTPYCHMHYWLRTGGQFTSANGGISGDAMRYRRTTGGTWGISRNSKNISLSLSGTGKDSLSYRCSGYHASGISHSGMSGTDKGNSSISPPNLLSSSAGIGGNPGLFVPHQAFLTAIRIPGTLWRWQNDPDQVVYRTLPTGKSDDIVFNMQFYHDKRAGSCGHFVFCNCGNTGATSPRDLIAEQLSPRGRRHIFKFQAEVAFGPSAGQPPGNAGPAGYLPTNDPRFIQGHPNYMWKGTGAPTTGTFPGTIVTAHTILSPGFNPNGYAPGLRSDGMRDGESSWSPMQNGWQTVGATGRWKGTEVWEIVSPVQGGEREGGIKFPSTSPAIFETEPKEDVGLNIYHEIGQVYPVAYGSETNELFTPVGSLVTCWRSGTGFVNLGGSGTNVPGSGDPWIPPIKVKACNDNTVDLVDAAGNLFVSDTAWPNEHIAQWDILVFTRPDGSTTESQVRTDPNGLSTYTLDVWAWPYKVVLPWFNCYSFGNGVESDRVRDDYNQVTIDNGPKASTTLDDPYQEERRGSGLIYSGIYNSISGVNNLNQFIAAEKITKDLNPTYGTIQKLFSRNTNLVTLCEDKILKVLANKDAMYNADGNINVTSNLNVLGQSVPFVGEYGISKNPESFASESYRAYFSDKQRGVVLRLSQDGVTPISEFGMKDWFADHLLLANRIIGSYDSKKQLYNITLGSEGERTTGPQLDLQTRLPLRIGLGLGPNPCDNLPCNQNCVPPELPSLPTSWGPSWTHQNGTTYYPGDEYAAPGWGGIDTTIGGPTDGKWGSRIITSLATWPNFLLTNKWNTFFSECPTNLFPPWDVWNSAPPAANSSGIMLRSNINHPAQPPHDSVHDHNSSGIMCKVDGLCVGEEYTIEVEYAEGWGTGNLVIGLEDAAGNPEGIITGNDGVNYNVLYGFHYSFQSFGPNFGSAGVINSMPFTATQADDNILAIDWHGTGDYTHSHLFPCPSQAVYPLIGCTGTLNGFNPPMQPFMITSVKLKCVNPPAVICGCTDPTASNYNPNATIDDESCVPIQGCLCPDGTIDILCCPGFPNNSFYEYFKTLSFSENSKGWVSFKSFMQEDGLSLNNTYFTWSEGQLWEHHANPIRNNYYGKQFDSSINILFNEAPETVKSFVNVNYEGSQSRITQDITAIATGGLYNDIPHFDDVPKDGWYVEFMETNLQTAGVLEFKNKEGKWFSYPRGEKTEWHNDNPAYWGADRGNIDPREFSYQGISNNCCRTINNGGVITQTGTCCQLPCTDPTFSIVSVTDITVDTSTTPCTLNADGEIQITATSTTTNCTTWDIELVYTGSGIMPSTTILNWPGNANGATLTIPNLIAGPYTLNITWCNGGPNCFASTTVTIGSQSVVSGCTDPTALNYNPSAVCDDGSCVYPVPGCTDPSAINCDPGCNGYNPLATVDDGSCCVVGCQDPSANNYVAGAHCPLPCYYNPSWNCSGNTGAVSNGVVIAPWNCYDPGNGTGQYQLEQNCINGCQANSCGISNAVYNSNGSITFTYNAPQWLPGDSLHYRVEEYGNGVVLLGNQFLNQIALSAGSGTITTAATLAGYGMVQIKVMHIPNLTTNPGVSTVECSFPIDTGINPTYTCSGYNGATDSNGTFHAPMTCYDPLDGSGLWPGTVQGLASCSQTGSCLTGACGAATGGCCPHVCCFAGGGSNDGLNSNGSITFSWNLDSHSCNHCTQFGGTATFELTENTVSNLGVLWTFTTTQCVGTVTIPAFHNGHDFAAIYANGVGSPPFVINGSSRTTCVDCCGANYIPLIQQPDGGSGMGSTCSWSFGLSGN